MPKSCTAINRVGAALLWLLPMLGCLRPAWAGDVVGTVMQLSGPLLAKKSDGKVKILALRSEVESGDTLSTERNTYALVKFIDNSEITLKPGTTFVVEQFAYDAATPAGDRATFNLLKGGLRSLSGLLGKRNREKFLLKTPVATIGIRGTYFIASYTAPPMPGMPDSPAPSGLALQVTDGMIVVANAAGQQTIGAGQFGFVATPTVAPLLVPANRGVEFAPPAAFDAAAAGKPAAPVAVSVSADGRAERVGGSAGDCAVP